MKDLIAEEEEAGRLQDERAAARAAAEKEKKAKKKERMRAKKARINQHISAKLYCTPTALANSVCTL